MINYEVFKGTKKDKKELCRQIKNDAKNTFKTYSAYYETNICYDTHDNKYYYTSADKDYIEYRGHVFYTVLSILHDEKITIKSLMHKIFKEVI